MTLKINMPVRAREDHGYDYKVLAKFESADHIGREVLLCMRTNRRTKLSEHCYRNADGTTLNGVPRYDIVNIDTAPVATMYHTMDCQLAVALQTLWKAEQFGPVVDVMVGLDGTLNRADVHHYFEGLWG